MTVQGPYYQPNGGVKSVLNITVPTVIKAEKGTLANVSVIAASIDGVTLFDTDTVEGIDPENYIAAIPPGAIESGAAQGVFSFYWPFTKGLVVDPGPSGIVAVSFY